MMAMTASEQEQFRRAERSLNASPLDPLSRESLNMALSLSSTALQNSSAEQRPGTEAITGLTIAFIHFASGSTKAAEDIALKIAKAITADAIEKHAQVCAKAQAKATRKQNFIEGSKDSLLSAPPYLTVFLCVCVWKFGDKFWMLFFG